MGGVARKLGLRQAARDTAPPALGPSPLSFQSRAKCLEKSTPSPSFCRSLAKQNRHGQGTPRDRQVKQWFFAQPLSSEDLQWPKILRLLQPPWFRLGTGYTTYNGQGFEAPTTAKIFD